MICWHKKVFSYYYINPFDLEGTNFYFRNRVKNRKIVFILKISKKKAHKYNLHLDRLYYVTNNAAVLLHFILKNVENKHFEKFLWENGEKIKDTNMPDDKNKTCFKSYFSDIKNFLDFVLKNWGDIKEIFKKIDDIRYCALDIDYNRFYTKQLTCFLSYIAHKVKESKTFSVEEKNKIKNMLNFLSLCKNIYKKLLSFLMENGINIEQQFPIEVEEVDKEINQLTEVLELFYDGKYHVRGKYYIEKIVNEESGKEMFPLLYFVMRNIDLILHFMIYFLCSAIYRASTQDDKLKEDVYFLLKRLNKGKKQDFYIIMKEMREVSFNDLMERVLNNAYDSEQENMFAHIFEQVKFHLYGNKLKIESISNEERYKIFARLLELIFNSSIPLKYKKYNDAKNFIKSLIEVVLDKKEETEIKQGVTIYYYYNPPTIVFKSDNVVVSDAESPVFLQIGKMRSKNLIYVSQKTIGTRYGQYVKHASPLLFPIKLLCEILETEIDCEYLMFLLQNEIVKQKIL